MTLPWYYGWASETLSGVTQLKIWNTCLFICVWTYVCHLVLWPSRFCVCFVVYPLYSTKQNFSISARIIQVTLIVYPFILGYFKLPQDTLQSEKLTITLCSNSLELLVFFSSCKMLWQMVTMVLRPFTRCNFFVVHRQLWVLVVKSYW